MTKPTIGIAALGFQGYSKRHCRRILSLYRGMDRKVLAFLWNSFGTDKENLLKWYKLCDDNSVTQVYLSNEVDRRKTRIDKNNLCYKLSPDQYNEKLEKKDHFVLKRLQERVISIVKFHNENGKGELRIALGLEHQMTRKALNSAVDAARAVAPDIKYISNPVGNGPFNGRGKCNYIEVHGSYGTPKPRFKNYIISTDGRDICTGGCGKNMDKAISDSELIKAINKFNDADYFLLWHSQFNSLTDNNSAALPPPYERKSSIEKKCTRYIKKNIILPFRRGTATPVPVIKPNCCNKLQNPFKTPGFLWKESEYGGLVVLFPAHYEEIFDKVVIREPNKRKKLFSTSEDYKLVPYSLRYTGNHANGNRQHWRHTKHAYEFKENSVIIAYRKNGKTLCWLIKDPTIRNEG